jgi:ABC-type Zn uptake system ZnuABC Zn-binding protein ZnuA
MRGSSVRNWLGWLAVAGWMLAALAACGSSRQGTSSPGGKLRVVATTNIVGDVVAQVGGDRIDLTVLMGIGVDPHSYAATPADSAAIHDADVVFSNGAGLEANLENLLANAGGKAVQVDLSAGLKLRPAPGQDGHQAADEHGSFDPHVWFDVQNVILWTQAIEQQLSALDPANAATYQANAEAYTAELKALDAWIVEQVATIPEAHRKLVTNHPAFGYLADRYGLEQVGAVYPVSPSAEPSAQDIAALQDAIRAYGVPAVFTESTVNPHLAEQVAQDTGVQLVSLYTGSLGGPGSGAETYLDLMRYDVVAIAEALK